MLDADAEGALRSRHRPYTTFDIEPAISLGASSLDDREIVQRIVASFRDRGSGDANNATSMWANLLERHYSDLLAAFQHGDMAKCSAALRDPSANLLTMCMDNLNSEATESYRNEDWLRDYVCMCQDNLLRLAEGIGAMRLGIPWHQDWLRFSATKPNDVLDNIDRLVGVRIDFPNPFPNENGLKTDRGVCCYRSLPAIYLAHRVKQLTAGVDNPKILEIGPGVGRSVYYARRMGLENYSTVDLPFPGGVLQAYFLMRSLGPENITLSGEFSAPGKVHIMTPADFFEGSEHYDLIVNMDSITEFGYPTALKYWNKIKASCHAFLSVNHEIHPYRVCDFARDGSARSYSRHPDWFRPGYVEEVIVFEK